jgi:excisionase family DNA binding protein
LIKFVAV